jgi:tripartite-type tricarboxylate transporter receptor subunit TctC
MMVGGLAALALPTMAAAQQITREVRLIAPVVPGGTIDVVARLLAQGLSPSLGRPIVVENRSGGAFFVGLGAVANAAPDGHTLGIAPIATLATAPILPGMTLPINPDTQLQPVVGLFRVPLVLVAGAHTSYSDLPGLLRFARANPGRTSIGHSGNGTTSHLVAARLANEAKIEVVQVAYRSGAPALTDLMAGHVDLYFALLPEVLPHIRDGRMKALAVASEAPNAHLPDVALVAQELPGFFSAASFAMVAPAGMPASWVQFWNRTVGDFLDRPEVRERMEGGMFLEITAGPVERMREEVAAGRVTWGKVIRDAGIRAE